MPEIAGPDSGAGSKPSPQFESFGHRFRFNIELRSGETTIVSWKKLLKEANITNGADEINSNKGPDGPGALEAQNQQQHLPPQLAAKQQHAEGEAEEPAGSNRLSSVIERIERMYAGNGSSDEEDVVLDNVPDDDEYDTEDSFIDDTELDDYFQVDKTKLKHDGFFINRGKLEHIEPPTSVIQQPKKRRRKAIMKEDAVNDVVNNLPKRVKLDNKENAADIPVKNKKINAKVTVDASETSIYDHVRQETDSEQQQDPPAKNNCNKLKESGEPQDTSIQKSTDKASTLNKSHSEQQSNNPHELDKQIQLKEKGARVERFDLNVPVTATATRESLELSKVPSLPRKEVSNVKQRSSILEKAIRELETIVSESRPPSTEVQVSDNSSQAVKKRLPPEVKQKLAKVARLSYAGFGKIPEDVLNRLMSIMGHLVQLRTLKRNIKIMANMGLSAKKEKDDQLRKIKHEVAEMVAQRIPYMKSKMEQQTTNSDDFQEAGPQEKKAMILKYGMDESLENKICDLYDLHIEKLEEDSGPPVKRLYEELAGLWPGGFMDTYGIKHSIYRAKKRRKALASQQKNPEKIKRKKMLKPKTEDTSRGESTNNAQSSHAHEDSRRQASDQAAKPLLSATICLPAANSPISFQNLSNMDKPRQEKMKGSSTSSNSGNNNLGSSEKKKAKKKPNKETGHLETVSEERLKQHKDAAAKPNVEQSPSSGTAS